MRLILLIALLIPAVALGQTITDNGNYQTQTCSSGFGRAEVFDGSGGYDSGTVTLQFYSEATESWETLCPTASDCQWSSGDSGAVPFDAGASAQVRFNVASVAGASADIDLLLICDSRRR